MHNAAFAALSLNWRYLAFEVHPDQLRAAIDGARAMNFVGLNLTVPHKLLAVDIVDALDDSAKRWGAVNTIRFERLEGISTTSYFKPAGVAHETPAGPETRAIGYNTDADAIVAALREDLKLELRGAKVLLLGAGGAGRTAALKLASEGIAELYLVNRTESKADAIAGEIKEDFFSTRATIGYPAGNVDLVINATSLGLQEGDPSPLDEKQFWLGRTRAVYDMIYRPAETALLQAAKAAGCQTANGLGMLLHQGAKAFEIWTGQPAPLDIMRKALEAEIYRSTVAGPQPAVHGSPSGPEKKG